MDQDESAPCAPAVKRSHDWDAGYETALADAIAVIESLGGPGFANLSMPVLLRLKTRLIELGAGRHAG